MERNAKIALGLFATIAVVTGGVFAYQKWGKPKVTEEQAAAEEEKKKVEAVAEKKPYVAPAVTDAFPLKYGVYGPNVKKLQEALAKHFGATFKATSKLLAKTEASLKGAGYALPLEQKDFDLVLNGKRKVSIASVYDWSGKTALAKESGVPIYDYNNRSRIVMYSQAGTSPGKVMKVIAGTLIALGSTGDLFPKYITQAKFYEPQA